MSDGNNRAHYDRYGEEEDVGRRTSQGGGAYGPADFDPDEIFNMFFGGGSFGGRCATDLLLLACMEACCSKFAAVFEYHLACTVPVSVNGRPKRSGHKLNPLLR